MVHHRLAGCAAPSDCETFKHMTDSIQIRRAQRREFLKQLYLRVDGSVSEFVAAYDLAAGLGIDEPEARKILEYFEEKAFVMVDDYRAGIVRITAAGVDAVESD
jgi:hypothetical protein